MPRRTIEDLQAHLLAWWKCISDSGKTPHAPPQGRVRLERRWRGQATRQLSPWLMTQRTLSPLVFKKIPVGKRRRSPCFLCKYLSFSGAFSVRALCKKMYKTDGAPVSCALFCLFRGSEASIHCAHCGYKKKKEAKNRKYPHKIYTQRRSTKANVVCALPQSTVDCETVHSV